MVIIKKIIPSRERKIFVFEVLPGLPFRLLNRLLVFWKTGGGLNDLRLGVAILIIWGEGIGGVVGEFLERVGEKFPLEDFRGELLVFFRFLSMSTRAKQNSILPN
jgi:hypothetical protein